MWWLIIVGLVCVATALVLLLGQRPKRPATRYTKPSTKPSFALERRSQNAPIVSAGSTPEREVWYEQQGDESMVRIKSTKPMHNIKLYIRTGLNSIFAIKVDDEDK